MFVKGACWVGVRCARASASNWWKGEREGDRERWWCLQVLRRALLSPGAWPWRRVGVLAAAC